MLCDLCTDEIQGLPFPTQGVNAHRECMLREVVGGIGHVIAHEYWCSQQGDPDAGLTYHQSAILVDAYVHVVGHPPTVVGYEDDTR